MIKRNASLFAHDEAWQWTSDLIWVNYIKYYGTTDYYVQKLFSTNKGTNVVNALRNGKPLTGQDSLYVSAVIDKKSNDVILKVVNASGKAQTNKFRLDGLKRKNSMANVTTLQSDDLTSMNSFGDPKNVAPQQSSLFLEGNIINLTCQPYSFSVLRIKM